MSAPTTTTSTTTTAPTQDADIAQQNFNNIINKVDEMERDVGFLNAFLPSHSKWKPTCNNALESLAELKDTGRGFVVGLLGRTGVGKSTLINRMCGQAILPNETENGT